MACYKIFPFFFLCIVAQACTNKKSTSREQKTEQSKPTVSFTFDDGITHDILDYPFEEWNAMILKSLEEADLKAMFFVTGFNKMDEKGKYLLSEWDQRNHKIANHTFSHPNFNNEKHTVEVFKRELLSTDSIIRSYANFVKYFRFPYLKEGNTREKIDGIRSVIQEQNYQNGYVTIDASDWYVNSRLIKKMDAGEETDTMAFQKYYVDHIMDRAHFYDSLAYQMNGRHIKHTLLLHHNLTSALFLKSLIKRFKSEGWALVDAEEAFKDSIYKASPSTVPAGESLIWSLAKESGRFEKVLRYPAEDSRYEKDKMDQLGL